MSYGAGTHVKAQSTTSNTVTSSSIDTSGNDTLVLGICDYVANTASTISDSKGNTWTQVGSTRQDTTDRIRLFIASPAIVGTGHTFTATVTAGFPAFAVMAFAGADSSPFHGENGGNTDSATNGVTLPGVTPDLNDGLLIAFMGSATTGTPDNLAIDSGFTLVESAPNVGSQAFGIGFAYKLVSAPGVSSTPAFSWTTNSGHFAYTQADFHSATPPVKPRPTWQRRDSGVLAVETNRSFAASRRSGTELDVATDADPTLTHLAFQGQAVYRM